MGHENEKLVKITVQNMPVPVLPQVLHLVLDTATRGTLSYYYLRSNDEPDAGIPFNNANPTKPPVGLFIVTPGDGKPVDVKAGTYYGWKRVISTNAKTTLVRLS